MKGTPETPQCGFSRATIQILGLQGVDPKKFTAFNVLEDPELRQGMHGLCSAFSLSDMVRELIALRY
jgi:glutaredoxin-related protein